MAPLKSLHKPYRLECQTLTHAVTFVVNTVTVLPPVSGVHQRGAGRGASRARRVVEEEGGPPELHGERPVGTPAAQEEEHAVGAASEQEERQAVESHRAHLAAEAQPVPTLGATGAVGAGQEPHEAPGPAHRGIR